jgi:hypothetical protein
VEASDVSCAGALLAVAVGVGTVTEGGRLRRSRYRAVVTTVKLHTKRDIAAYIGKGESHK